MSVAKYASSSSAPSLEERKGTRHSRKFDYPKAPAGPEPDQLAPGLVTHPEVPVAPDIPLGIHPCGHGQSAELY